MWRSIDFEGDISEYYEQSPELFVKFITEFYNHARIDKHKLFELYGEVKSTKHKGQIFKLLTKKVEESLNNEDKYRYDHLSNHEISFIDDMLDKLPKDTRKAYGKKFVSTFIDDFNCTYKTWRRSNYLPEKHHYLNKDDYVDLAEKYIGMKLIDPILLIKECADNLSVRHLKRLIDCVPEGNSNKRVKKALRNSKKYEVLGYDQNDLGNHNSRRAFLRKIVRGGSPAARKLLNKVEIKVSDLSALNAEERWDFLSNYYGYRRKWSVVEQAYVIERIKPKGYGRKIVLERDPTVDELESLLFPILIGEYEAAVVSFIKRYRKYYELQSRKGKRQK